MSSSQPKTSSSNSPSSWLNLFWVYLRVSLFHYFETLRVIFRYYRSFSFLKTDLRLQLGYLVKSPFQLHKGYKGEKDLYIYGETPLTAIDRICRKCSIQSSDTLIDLGCGTGRAAFWIAHFVRCRTVGVDLMPRFIEQANRLRSPRVSFRQEDILTTDLSGATVIYLYGTCLSDDDIEKLCHRFAKLPRGTKIITVTYPLSAYSPAFVLEKSFTAPFPWGKGDVYLTTVG